jgi:hypothetical protein
VAQSHDDPILARSEIVTLHWEGPPAAVSPPEHHATVRTWISEVAKLAYQVGYRLHEDRLVLAGDAPPELKRLRELVKRDGG